MAKVDGLTQQEAQRLLSVHGYNEISRVRKKPLWVLSLGIIREPMVLLLLIGASIYFLLGEPYDSILLLLSVVFIVCIAIYQEVRSTRALEALRDLSSPRALVIRDGREIRIASREVVPGDIIVIKEGDRIAADSQLLESRNLEVDESLLTGESQPVAKELRVQPVMVFSSTLVTSGFGNARVVATGPNTEVGKIGKSLDDAQEDKTRLQQEIGVLVRQFGVVGILFSVLVVLAYVLTRGDWPQGILAGIATAMALLPEEFPVILTIFLALGAWRLSRSQVLVRQSAATENLGGVTVLCVDKTGTLTMNQMQVQSLWTPNARYSSKNKSDELLPDDIQELVAYGVLSSRKDPFDPMEKAILQFNVEHPHKDVSKFAEFSLMKEYALTPVLLAMTQVWQQDHGEFLVAAKGAAEAILKMCRLEGETYANALAQVEQMSHQGLRVIAVAKGTHSGEMLPPNQTDFQFQFLGYIGFEDPLRAQVPSAIRECDEAGIRVIMITGDHPGTAAKIAKSGGLKNSEVYLTGADIDKMNELEFRNKIRNVNIFARMVPSQKLRIVNALKANGEVVGMTGDGVNDAPSLKWADVGIAMGGRGTDVAREAADLVILDDDFTSIVAAIRLGRRIFDNIRKAMSYVFAVHVPIAGLAISPVLFGMPLLLFPAHIVFLELIIDPACTLIFEAEPDSAQLMKRPPRSLKQPLFGYSDILHSSFRGFLVFVVIFILYYITLSSDFSEERSRTIAFLAFVLSNICLIVVSSSAQSLIRNRFFWSICAVAGVSLIAVITVPVLRLIFGLSLPSLLDLFLAVFTAFCSVLGFSFLKEKSKLWDKKSRGHHQIGI